MTKTDPDTRLVEELRQRADMVELQDADLAGYRPRSVTIMRQAATVIERLLDEAARRASSGGEP